MMTGRLYRASGMASDEWCPATVEDDRGLIFECERSASHEGPHRGVITREWIEEEDDQG